MPRLTLMKFAFLLYRWAKRSSVFAIVLMARDAHAIQPLSEFISAGRSQSFDSREHAVLVEQRSWEKEAALGRLLPSFSARGVLQYNEYEIEVPLGPGGSGLTLQPHAQVDGLLQLDLPLIHVASYYRYRQAKHLEEAAEAQANLSRSEVERQIVRAYYNFVGASALLASAQNSVELAERNASQVRARLEAGASTELDLTRASANLERSRQDLADAEFGSRIAARNLRTLTGIEATPVDEFPIDDLAPEIPLERWLAKKDTPSDRVQLALTRAQESGASAAKSALLPVLSAHAQERLTNVGGFVGQNSYYTLQAALTWSLDYSVYATARAQSAVQRAQEIRAERARNSLDDSLFEAYHRVEAGIVKCRAARAQVAAAERAAELALARYQAGALTQLDVTQSQRDAFLARAGQIQADSDLLVARATLRVLSGLSPNDAKTTPRADSEPRADSDPTSPGGAKAEPPKAPEAGPNGTGAP